MRRRVFVSNFFWIVLALNLMWPIEMAQSKQLRFYGVMVSTQDSESCDPSSNLGRTWHLFSHQKNRFELDRRFNQLSHGADVGKSKQILQNVSPNVGLEPTTLRLRVSCSTDWASRALAVFCLSNKSRSPLPTALWIVWHICFIWMDTCKSRSPCLEYQYRNVTQQ